MAYTKTVWVDHVTTRPNTYNEVVNQDGTKTLTPAGETQQEGTPVNAENLNHMEQGIFDAQKSADDNLTAAENYADTKSAAEVGTHALINVLTGIHGLKYDKVNSKFQYYENGEWHDIDIGVTVDNQMSTTSRNPLENQVITNTLLALLGVDLPTQSGTLTYDGSSKSPSWTGYDSTKLSISGTTSGTNAGSYEATFTPIAPYCWGDDGTRTPRTATWTIGRATGTLSLSSTSVTTLKNASTTVTLTTNSDGTKSAESNATGKVTASVSGTTVTLTGGSTSGSATVTVSIAQSTNYTAVSKTISVNNIVASSTLGDNSPSTIQAVAQAGQASNLWSVGDKIGISLSGTVGSLSISGTYYAFIIGFNHNSSREGSNSIHFMFGKTSGGTNIAFCDSSYNNYGSGAMFHMNSSNTNSGGWSSSYMRSTICPSFKSAMPSAWQNVIASCTKYSDNTGGGSDTASYVTSTTDYIFLLSEYEVQGARSYANSKEKDYQQQYAYFANGNSKVFNKHNATSTACYWWLRSVYATYSNTFCFVYTDGSVYDGNAYYSYGFAPGFKVA